MFVCCECCVLSGRGLCDGLIPRPEESYRLWRVVVRDQGNLGYEEAKARYWAVKIQPQWVVTPGKQTKTNMLTELIKFFCMTFKLNSTFIPLLLTRSTIC
jgi:hypothetical protein